MTKRERSTTGSVGPETVAETAHIIDSGVFIKVGGPANSKFEALQGFARRNDTTFLVPKRVVAELEQEAASDRLERARDEGWAERYAEDLNYANPAVSNTTDIVTRYIATKNGIQSDEVEKTDAALGGIAVQLIDRGADAVVIYTTDRLAGAGIRTALSQLGYDDRIDLVDANSWEELSQ